MVTIQNTVLNLPTHNELQSIEDHLTTLMGVVSGECVDLLCPFYEKEQVKRLGAVFNWTTKVWFVPAGRDLTPFTQWLPLDWWWVVYSANR